MRGSAEKYEGKLSAKKLHNNLCKTSIRVHKEIFSGQFCFYFLQFLSIELLIKWSYFVDVPYEGRFSASGTLEFLSTHNFPR